LFADLAVNDNGVRFLHHVNKVNKSKIDTNAVNSKSSNPSAHMHFCTCNKAFIPETSFWVPEKVYSFGKDFIK
jgi:hypothetical protein